MSELRPGAKFQRYLTMPLMFMLILVATNVAVYLVSKRAGALVTVGLLVYFLIQIAVYLVRRRILADQLIAFANRFAEERQKAFRGEAVPSAVIDDRGRVLTVNDTFRQIVHEEKSLSGKQIDSFLADVTPDQLPAGDDLVSMHLSYGSSYFEALIRRIDTDAALLAAGMERGESGRRYYALLLRDETELQSYIRKCRDEAMVAGLVYIDNYDEALDSVEDVRRSLLTALIERKIGRYFHDIDGVVRKFEKDKFLLVMNRRALDELIEQRFSILEHVKTVNIGNDLEVTISIGIGADFNSLSDNFEAARVAIDLALGRGGDQAVVKAGDTNRFFGGKAEAVEKSTRVKARVKAHALKEFIQAAENVVVMGHQLIDADAFGAAIGIYRASRSLGKNVSIVIDKVTTSMRPLIDLFRNSDEFDEKVFVSTEEAEHIVGRETLLVVVDTSKPSYTACPAVLKKTETIVLLDHHRQGKEVVGNAVLSYIEPYASSACEMVAEILQYFSDDLRIRSIEADALYAGIMVDTDNFMQKTGVRTFEAAAYLRRNGADVTQVRKLFREDMADYRARGETIRSAIRYRDNFAIAVCPTEGIESPTIVASQSANALLNIIGVRASFVLTEYDDRIYVSARSIDEVNVQIIMERLGGGGHLNMAGCQLYDVTIEEAIEQLKKTLDQMLDEGEL